MLKCSQYHYLVPSDNIASSRILDLTCDCCILGSFEFCRAGDSLLTFAPEIVGFPTTGSYGRWLRLLTASVHSQYVSYREVHLHSNGILGLKNARAATCKYRCRLATLWRRLCSLRSRMSCLIGASLSEPHLVMSTADFPVSIYLSIYLSIYAYVVYVLSLMSD